MLKVFFHLFFKAVFLGILCTFPVVLRGQDHAVHSHHYPDSSKNKAELLWHNTFLPQLSEAIREATHAGQEEIDRYLMYVNPQLQLYLREFFEGVVQGRVNETNIPILVSEKAASYIIGYTDFAKQSRSALFQNRPNPTHSSSRFLTRTDGDVAPLGKDRDILPLGANEPCTNVDFEEGTTRGWNGWLGRASTTPDPTSLTSGFFAAHHTIMTGGYDPNIGAQLPTVCPGGAYSLRLENTELKKVGGDASRISQTFRVTSANANFTYKYAVVLEDPGTDHTDEERPYFKVRLLNQQGQEIVCGQYSVMAKPPIEGFEQIGNSNVYWRNWTAVSIPLSAYIGQNVTIEFTASDCAKTGHLGYAYIDGSCFPLKIDAPYTIVCGPEGVPLTAPTGFASYRWEGPGIVGDPEERGIRGNQPGTYRVTMTSVSGAQCQSVLAVTLGVNTDITAGPDVAVCSGESIQLQASTGPDCRWSPATGLSDPTSPNPIARPDSTTTYTISSCGVTDQVTVYVKPSPVTLVSEDVTICPGSSTILTASGADSYSWFPATGLSSTTGATVVASPTVTTTYTVTGTAANGCISTTTVKVTVIRVTIPPQAAICQGGSTTLTASGADSYSWFPATGLSSTTGASVVASPTIPTTYTVTGERNGCITTAQVTVAINPPPALSISPSTIICAGSSTNLTASGASTYIWSPATGLNTTTGASVVASPAFTTTYTVTGRSAGGCISTATVTVTVNQLPALSVSSSRTICAGSSTTLIASGASTYSWFPATGLNTTTGASVIATPATTTTYTVTGRGVNGCISTATVTLTVPQIIVSPNTSTCQGSPVILSASGGANRYTWSPATGLSSMVGSSVTARPTVSTIYTVTGRHANGCISTAKVTVDITPRPVGATMSNPIVAGVLGQCDNFSDTQRNVTSNCFGNDFGQVSDDIFYVFTLNTRCEVELSHCNSGFDTYLHLLDSHGSLLAFNDDKGPLCIGNRASIRTKLNPGTYYVVSEGYLSYTGAITTQIVTRPTEGTVSLPPEATICQGGSTTLTARGADTYSWSPATGLSSATGDRVEASPADTTTYTVTGHFANGCTSTATVRVNVNPKPVLTISPDTTICPGTRINLAASGAEKYQWTGSLDSLRGASVPVSPDTTTTYTVTGTSKYGCTATAKVTVFVKTIPQITVSPDVTICEGDSAILTVAGTATFYWSSGKGVLTNSQSELMVSPDSTTTYTVAGNTDCGPTAPKTVTVFVKSSVTPDVTICRVKVPLPICARNRQLYPAIIM